MNRFWITIAIKGYIYVEKRLILKKKMTKLVKSLNLDMLSAIRLFR